MADRSEKSRLYTLGRRLRLKFRTTREKTGEKVWTDDIQFWHSGRIHGKAWREISTMTGLPRALGECFVRYVYWTLKRPGEPFVFENEKGAITVRNGLANSQVPAASVFVSEDGLPCYRQLWNFGWSGTKGDGPRPPVNIRVAEAFLPADCVEIEWDKYPNQFLHSPDHLEELLGLLCYDFVPLVPVHAVTTNVEVINSTPNPSGRSKGYVPRGDVDHLFGRKREIETGIKLVRESRLVTVHALAASGKTRVIIPIATHFFKNDADLSVYYVDVNYTSSAIGVARKVQERLELPPLYGSDEQQQVQLADHLQKLGRTLLVLDNFEQVGVYDPDHPAPGVAKETVEVWLKGTEELRILVGCRWPLSPRDWVEKLISIGPLGFPRLEELEILSVEQLRNFDGVRLFRDRALPHRSEEYLDKAAHVKAAADIVARVGGHAGAIVVAAGLLRTHHLPELSKKYKRIFADPTDSFNFGLDQLYASVDRLQRTVLLQAARFRGGFNFPAAQAIIVDDNGNLIDEIALSVALDGLVKVNFLNYEETERGDEVRARFSFYTPVEEWAERKWNSREDITEALRIGHAVRFAEYFCGLFEKKRRNLERTMSPSVAEDLFADRENLNECHYRACERGDAKSALRAVQAITPLLRAQGPATLMQSLLKKTLLFAEQFQASERATLWRELSESYYFSGEYIPMLKAAAEAVKFAEESGDRHLLMNCLASEDAFRRIVHGDTGARDTWKHLQSECLKIGDMEGYSTACREIARDYDVNAKPELALALCETAVEEYRKRGTTITPVISSYALVRLVNIQGIVAWHAGQPRLAVQCLEAALRAFQKLGNDMWVAGVMTNLGLVLIDLEDFDGAERMLTEAATLHTKGGNLGFKSVNDVSIARLYCRQGQFQEAIEQCERIENFVESIGYYENKYLMRSIHGIALHGAGRIVEALERLSETVAGMKRGSAKMRRYFETLVVAAECAIKFKNMGQAAAWLREAETVAKLRRIDGRCEVLHYKRVHARFQRLVKRL